MRVVIYSAAAALSLVASFPAVSATSTFDTTTEGWSIVGDVAGPVTWNATGGNPGGYISVVDSVVGGVMYWVAPAAYLGNQSSAFGTALTFDLIQNFPGSPNQFADDDVVLQGNGLRLVHQHANPANGAWTSYSALLTGSSWHVDSASGALATDGQLQSVLSDLTTLLIRAEYQTGADTDGLDNVALFQSPPGETPLPGALPLFASGLGMLGFIAHRRKRKAVAA